MSDDDLNFEDDHLEDACNLDQGEIPRVPVKQIGETIEWLNNLSEDTAKSKLMEEQNFMWLLLDLTSKELKLVQLHLAKEGSV